ncbi:MAG: hypothetical protein ACTHM6_08660 [Tepidisphaeraceae bacterium]
MPFTDPITFSLTLLLAAAALVFAGTRSLWWGSPGTGLLRGALAAVPVTAIGILFAVSGQVTTGVALMLACCVFMVTLGIGVAAVNAPAGGGVGSPLLRLLAPITLVTCVVGFHGELTLVHAVALLVTGILLAWTASEGRPRMIPRANFAWLGAAIPLLGGGIYLLLIAIQQFQSAAGANLLGPVVVLMVGPAALISLLGLLGRPDENGEGGCDTVVGFALNCLGFGLPIIIAIGHWIRHSAATTKTAAAVIMPVASWRIDSLLLVMLSILLIPVSIRRFKLGRLEGLALVILYLVYARVSVHTVSLAR